MIKRNGLVLVSSCLAGISCRYDGKHSAHPLVERLVSQGQAVPVCPEVLGGLPIPRACCELVRDGGKSKVIDQEGTDRTVAFEKGARSALAVARAIGCRQAILKARSPSCGFGQVYDGTFSGRQVSGNGIAADLLARAGIQVMTEEQLAPPDNHD